MYPDFSPETAPLASLGRRYVGQLIDSFVPGLIVSFCIFYMIVSQSMFSVFLVGITVLCEILYILFADGLGEGQSLGKRMLSIQVVDSRTGVPCTFWQSFLRNIFYLLGFFDWIFIFGETRQRLGDKVAGTIVVDAH